MNRQRFEALAQAYGADLRRFPANERRDARAFLAEHDDARALLKREAALDELLDVLSDEGDSDTQSSQQLQARIVERAPAQSMVSSRPPTNVVPLRPQQRAASGLLFAAAAAAGLWFGAQSPDDASEIALDDSEQLAVAFDPLDWEDQGTP